MQNMNQCIKPAPLIVIFFHINVKTDLTCQVSLLASCQSPSETVKEAMTSAMTAGEKPRYWRYRAAFRASSR